MALDQIFQRLDLRWWFVGESHELYGPFDTEALALKRWEEVRDWYEEDEE